MSIFANVNNILEEIKSSRSPMAKLVCVTKQRSLKEIEGAIEAGVKIIGENRVQEAERKFPLIENQVEKHFIGHLQKNKVQKALLWFEVIQSVESVDLGRKINQEAEKLNSQNLIRVPINIFLQVNICKDPKKYGFNEEELFDVLKELSVLPYLKIIGLMTILELTSDRNKTRLYFQNMKQLFEDCKKLELPNLELGHLSMGMSDDYAIALEEGATMIRVGRRIFEG